MPKIIPKCHFMGVLGKNRASGKPHKAPPKIKSRHTALFAISRYRGSGEPTEAFFLKLTPKFASKMPKMAILTPFFNIFEHFCFFGQFIRQKQQDASEEASYKGNI